MNKCNKSMSYEECELTILRSAVDKAEDIKGYIAANSKEIKDIIYIVEEFLAKKELIAYGGTAINNILPEHAQFYDKKKEIPDYDFYSSDAMNDAIELANIYYEKGYEEIEAKAGVHHGTYKVYVNFIPIADITYMNKSLFNYIKKDTIKVDNILYLPPNVLRMSMYLELSRPAGDISRWEKVLKRLTLLNKYYPIEQCKYMTYNSFMRKFENKKVNQQELYYLIKIFLANQGVVFFGGYSSHVYSQFMPPRIQKKIHKAPDFDVLSIEAKKCATLLKEHLERKEFKNINIVEHTNVGEIIPEHYQIKINDDTICFIYQTKACYNYNVIKSHNMRIKIATIDTMLSLYLAFLYANREYYDVDRIICMAHFLFQVQKHNRLAQKGVLRRFSIKCYGNQPTLESMRKEKSEMFEKLKDKKDSDEYNAWFLNYKPNEEQKKMLKQEEKEKKKANAKTRKKKSVSVAKPKKKTLKDILKKYFKK